MLQGSKLAVWIASGGVVVAILAALIFIYSPHRKPITINGAVVVQDMDSRERLPIAGVEVTGRADGVVATGKSDPSGLFGIQLPRTVSRGDALTLQFRHPEYQALDLPEFASDKLFVVQMAPRDRRANRSANQRNIPIGSPRIRYSMKAMTTVNIGSAAKPFQVVNAGNVPCEGGNVCSPDRKWKAAIGSAFLDAGPGNEFRNARVSCIAGPCPFTKIEKDEFSRGGQTIKASARNWSDTTTFLMEAEVFRSMVSEIAHESRPVMFGRALDFTLPPSAEGVCIEADMDGQTIIFPLGPALLLSWANCDVTANQDQSKVYRCTLKAGYQFTDTPTADGAGPAERTSK